MIPKVIHYCWFGGKEKPTEVIRCIESWKKYCPNYKIIEWNEKNYDYQKNEYTKYCYEHKLWAFFTDYVRLDIIYSYGGIYLDTDVEVIKSFDPLLKEDCFLGMEEIGTVNTGEGFGAEKGNPIIKENKEFYENKFNFFNNGKFKKIICVKITTDILTKYGLRKINEIQSFDVFTVYPPAYFCPKKMGTNKITITKDTYSIHHFDSSWKSNNLILRKIGYYTIPVKVTIKKIIYKILSWR